MSLGKLILSLNVEGLLFFLKKGLKKEAFKTRDASAAFGTNTALIKFHVDREIKNSFLVELLKAYLKKKGFEPSRIVEAENYGCKSLELINGKSTISIFILNNSKHSGGGSVSIRIIRELIKHKKVIGQ